MIIIGLLLTLTGLHGLLLVALPRTYAEGWHTVATAAQSQVEDLLEATTLAGQQDSWLWIVVVLVMIALVLLMAGWIAVQGRGRAGVFVRGQCGGPDDGAAADGTSGAARRAVPGTVTLSASVPEQFMRQALAGRNDLVSVHVSTWEPVRTGSADAAWRGHGAGLQIKVQPRLGAAPRRIAEDIAQTVQHMDAALGQHGPVVIHLAAGARTRMSRAERVR
nr:hypothetical protein [Zhihengliuella flava]